ncbi:hypothetical protein TD95_001739 [Thielaviopsis punctulata]|uniref:Helicase ATP-binding domain-containing protein n=1 Tax=Thielaviopsis punctulata TaxID=72032 RepID=A0A0F4ZBY7_9PEZI|nr:hypothetical protein TD95_001739 [Thielaviopsis punctulata]
MARPSNPDPPAKKNSIDGDLDDDELDRLINETAALGQSWFDQHTSSAVQSKKQSTPPPAQSKTNGKVPTGGHAPGAIQNALAKTFGRVGRAVKKEDLEDVTAKESNEIQNTPAKATTERTKAFDQQPSKPSPISPSSKSQKSGHVISSRKQAAVFNMRKQRPEHHLDNSSAHRIVPRSEAPLPLYKPKRLDSAAHTFDTMNTFGTMDYRPTENKAAAAMAPDQNVYMDPAKALSDLKALLEGGMDDDDDDDVKEEEEEEREEGGKGSKSLEKSVDYTAIRADGSLTGLTVKLLPHQVEGVTWMKGRELGPVKRGKVPKGGILADDMGLGKTLQTLSLILSHQKPVGAVPKKKHYADLDKSTLVVAPLALIRQWEAEIKDKVGTDRPLSVCVHHGPQRSRNPDDLAKFDVVVTTYQILVSEHSSSMDNAPVGCLGVKWWRVVLDEAHTIKNRNAKATKACCALTSEFRWCLTGTPMQNNLDELQSLVCFLRIRPYDDLREWRENIDKPMKNGKGHIAIRRLHSLLRCFMKRRTKDILKEEGALQPGGKAALDAAREKGVAEGKPAGGSVANSTGFRVTQRRIQPISTTFTPAEKRFYDRLEDRADRSMQRMLEGKLNYANALVLLLRLRQACNHPKLVEGKIEKDREAVGDAVGKAGKTGGIDVDSLTDMFAGVDITMRICSICGREMQKKDVDPEMCGECLADLAYFDMEQEGDEEKEPIAKKEKPAIKETNPEKKPTKKTKKPIDPDKTDREDEQSIIPRARRAPRRKIVYDEGDDDDEEEEEGSWIVSDDDRGSLNLGRAGGTTDEDAEGGGDTLGSDSAVSEDDEDESRLESFVEQDDDDGPEDYESDGNESDVSSGNISVSGNVSESEDAPETDNSTSDSDSDSTPEPDKPAAVIASSKIRELLRILNAEAYQHKFIVFSQFTSMLTLVEPFLSAANLGFVRYDGSMRNDERESSLARLRSDVATRVLLCSLKCGSLGLNLTAATRVVILEPFWNPFIEEQAIDRVHRLTQTVDVVVYKLTVAGTVEERILQLQERKRLLAEQAIEGGMKKNAFKLGMKEMLELFGREQQQQQQQHVERRDQGYEDEKKEPVRQRQRGVLRGQKEKPEESGLYGRRW